MIEDVDAIGQNRRAFANDLGKTLKEYDEAHPRIFAAVRERSINGKPPPMNWGESHVFHMPHKNADGTTTYGNV